MKKIICLLCFVLLFMASCTTPNDNNAIDNSSSTSTTESQVPDNSNSPSTTESQVPDNSDSPSTEPIIPPNRKYVNYDTRMERFYIDRPVETNLSAQIDDYARGGTASEEFISLYNQADSTRIIPIYGRYLEYSSLVCCAFLKENKIIGSRCLVVCYENGGINVKEIHQVLTQYNDKKTYPESNFSYLRELDSADLVNFNIIGIQYTVPGAAHSDLINTLIGTHGDDANLKYLHGLFISPFPNVEPFKTIEEGQALFEEYLKNINS